MSSTTSTTPPSRRSLGRNFSWALLGNIVFAGCQWGLVVAVARTGGPVDVGKLALALAVSSPVLHLTSLGLRPVQAVDVSAPRPLGDYMRLRLFSLLPATLIIYCLSLLFATDGTTVQVILLVALARALESVGDIYYGHFQRDHRLDWIAQSQLLKGPLSLAALAAGVYLTHDLRWGAIGWALAAGLVLVMFDMRLNGRLAPAAKVRPAMSSGESMREIFIRTWPMGISLMLVSLGPNIPRFVIDRDLGPADLGVFAAMATLNAAGGLVVGAICQAYVPTLARQYAEGNVLAFRNLLLRTTLQVALLGVLGIAGAVVLGPFVLRTVYGSAYVGSAAVLPWLMTVGAIGYVTTVFFYGMTATQTFHIQVRIFTASNLLSFAMCLMLIPRFGLRGAAAAMALSGCLEATCAGWSNRAALIRLRTSTARIPVTG